MKTFAILLTMCLLLVATPLGAADGSDCHQSPPREGVAHPIHADRYLFLDVTKPGKLGEWQEGNGFVGLQTDDCWVSGAGFLQYRRDVQTLVLG